MARTLDKWTRPPIDLPENRVKAIPVSMQIHVLRQERDELAKDKRFLEIERANLQAQIKTVQDERKAMNKERLELEKERKTIQRLIDEWSKIAVKQGFKTEWRFSNGVKYPVPEKERYMSKVFNLEVQV